MYVGAGRRNETDGFFGRVDLFLKRIGHFCGPNGDKGREFGETANGGGSDRVEGAFPRWEDELGRIADSDMPILVSCRHRG